ncbi:MAG: hypothetical protein KDA22_12705 [Phycisphaerales bacterium]|nr:hypothetical protein [Phycisphaerales bacterium]
MNARTNACVGAVVALASAQTVLAADYTYTRIALDPTVPSILFATGHPVINSAGEVAFGMWSLGDPCNEIYVGNGGPLSVAFDCDGPTSTIPGFPAINDAGVVSVWANRDVGPQALLTSTGAVILEVVPPIASIFSGRCPISASGMVAARVVLTNGFKAIYAGDGSTLVTVAAGGGGGPFGDILSDPDMNASGTIVFVGVNSDGWGVYAWSGGGFSPISTQIASGIPGVTLVNFGSPMISDAGVVAFYAQSGTLGSGLFVASGGIVQPKVLLGGSILGFGLEGQFDVNDAGEVAYYAAANVGGVVKQGIFVGPDPNTDAVILQGDSLDGSTATNVYMSRGCLNNAGQVAFTAILANGQSGVYVATPTPSGPLGDLNGDGVVDGADLGALLAAWGGSGPADLDGNGVVDGGDLGILLANWT